MSIDNIDDWLHFDDESEPWDLVSNSADTSEHFLPPVSKSSQPHQSKIGTSSNLTPSAPLPIPAPPPKQGRYPIIAGRPLPVPAFRPPMVKRDVQVNKPPAVHKPSLMQTSNMQTAAQHFSGAFPISRPAKVSSTTAVTARTKFPSQCPHLVQLFIECVSSLGQHCKLHEVLTASHHSKIHIHSVLDQFAASTVWRYLSIWQHFHRAVLDMDLSIDMSESELADVIVALSLAHHSDKSTGSGSISTIKALRWMTKTAGITALESVAYGTVISSFLKSKIPRERKEAFPLSLFVVLQWERRILQSNCPTRDVILLGGFLACIFAGLRFSDLQRVSWKSIVFDYKTVRGTCWRTKTSSSGQPFGFHCHGFLSRGEHSWAFKWLQSLDASGYLHQSTDLSMPCPHFLLPAMDALGLVQPLQPMTYARALKLLRWSASLPWKSGSQPLPCLNLTLHSLKTTMLSWGAQIADSAKISLEERQTQGHHRLHGASQSVRLYGRDDVFSQLSFQAKLVKGVHEGFRFSIPQHRGSQQPVREPEISKLECFNKQLPEHEWKFFDFSSNEQAVAVSHPDVGQADDADQIDSSSDSSSDGSESQSSDDEPASKKICTTGINDIGPVDEALVAFSANIQHCMITTSESHGLQYGQCYWRTACGAFLNPDRVGFGQEPQSDKQLCRRKGCMKLWSKWY